MTDTLNLGWVPPYRVLLKRSYLIFGCCGIRSYQIVYKDKTIVGEAADKETADEHCRLLNIAHCVGYYDGYSIGQRQNKAV